MKRKYYTFHSIHSTDIMLYIRESERESSIGKGLERNTPSGGE